MVENFKIKNKKINYEVELYRFIFSVIILLHHSYHVVGKENAIMRAGSLAVEFFFLLSGYLMMNTIEKRNSNDGLIRETIHFVLKKVRGLFPELFLSFSIGFLFVINIQKMDLKMKTMTIFNTLLNDVFMLKMTGLINENQIGGIEILPIVWYVSSMVLSMLFLYPLYAKLGKNRMFRIMMDVLAIIITLYMRGLRNPFGMMGGIYRGNYRCFAELILGTSIYWIKKENYLVNIRCKKILVSILKYSFLLTTIILFALPFGGARKDYLVFVLIYSLLLIVMVNESSNFAEYHRIADWGGAIQCFVVSMS